MLHGICCEPASGATGQNVGFEKVTLPLPPSEVAARLATLGGLVWLDSAAAGAGAVSILTAAPVEIISGRLGEEDDQLRSTLQQYRSPATSGSRIPAGGMFGWIGFDGEFTLGVYPHCLVYHHDRGLWNDFGGLAARLPQTDAPRRARFSPQPLDFQPQLSKAGFLASVERARDYIAAGDIYQVNLSYPWSAAWPDEADPLAFYERLRAVSPSPFAAYVDLAGTRLCSASPECFLQLSGPLIQTRPIKGTRPRFAASANLDAAAASELLHSEKERAELLMITDLERNDLGIVCEFGSIAVPELWRVESFAQVHHLVSTVTGRLRPEVDHIAALRACFPGGSISGAPKKRALEIIGELESFPRGIYTGAIGYFGFNGESQFNIAIRTAVQKGAQISFHVGAGIVADSVPEREHEETLHKAGGLLLAAREAPRAGELGLAQSITRGNQPNSLG